MLFGDPTNRRYSENPELHRSLVEIYSPSGNNCLRNVFLSGIENFRSSRKKIRKMKNWRQLFSVERTELNPGNIKPHHGKYLI